MPPAAAAAPPRAHAYALECRPPWSITTSGRGSPGAAPGAAKKRAGEDRPLVGDREHLTAEMGDGAVPADALALGEVALGDGAVASPTSSSAAA